VSTSKAATKTKVRRTIKTLDLRGTISRRRIAKAVREVSRKHT